LDLQGIELNLNSTRAGVISLVSQVQSGDGRMTLVGDLNGFGTANWRAQAFINGTDFRVVSLPQLKANLSPDIKVTADASAMHLTGDAVIPWARANIKSLPPSATQVSSDVVIVDEKFLQEQSVSPFSVYSNLNLSLGKDVSFKGFGLSSKLTGRLNLLKEAHRPFFTNGYVSVSEGSYKAYGQTLTIERGRLAFQGPYDNPGLDIRATRQIRDSDSTKVGLDIDGTLQRPKAKVFSSPSRSDSEAMMMLLTGKPIKDASDADASLLLSAMSGLGMDSGGSITAEINRFFRVDQLEVKSDDGIDQSQLWVGKYLTPKLLVRYVVGIFDQAFSFGIEYQLTDSFRIEAESGETKTVDLIYKIER
jgi:translocation and assembly module TamB